MNLVFLANPSSPHVRQWVQLVSPATEIKIYCIGENWSAMQYPNNLTVHQPLPKFCQLLPKVVRYFLLGVYLRWNGSQGSWFHAHNCSGYGLSAIISRKKYIVTTYGSEVFAINYRSRLYRWVLKAILKKSIKVTTTSDAMKSFIVDNLGVPSSRIESFSLGVASTFEHYEPKNNERESGEITWFANRRILPLYCTLELVQSFSNFRRAGGKGKLWLLRGDSDGEYLDRVRKSAQDLSKDIVMFEDFLTMQQMRALLRKAHFTISIPLTDQLSSSILEGMSQGAVPVLRPLVAYSAIDAHALSIDPTSDIVDALTKMFFHTAAIDPNEWEVASRNCIDIIRKNYSVSSVRQKYLDIIRDVVEARCV